MTSCQIFVPVGILVGLGLMTLGWLAVLGLSLAHWRAGAPAALGVLAGLAGGASSAVYVADNVLLYVGDTDGCPPVTILDEYWVIDSAAVANGAGVLILAGALGLALRRRATMAARGPQ